MPEDQKTPQEAHTEEFASETTKDTQNEKKPHHEASVASDEALEGEQEPQKVYPDTIEVTIVENGYVIYARSKYDQLSKMYVERNFFRMTEKVKKILGVIDDFKNGKQGRQK